MTYEDAEMKTGIPKVILMGLYLDGKLKKSTRTFVHPDDAERIEKRSTKRGAKKPTRQIGKSDEHGAVIEYR